MKKPGAGSAGRFEDALQQRRRQRARRILLATGVLMLLVGAFWSLFFAVQGAYLHAAAVVKAGIYLLFRFSIIFHSTLIWNVLLVGLGLFTSVLAAWFAMQQVDLKKLMAYSTVSQLGLITATIGVGTSFAIAAALLHTIAHESTLTSPARWMATSSATAWRRRVAACVPPMRTSFSESCSAMSCAAGGRTSPSPSVRCILMKALLHRFTRAW